MKTHNKLPTYTPGFCDAVIAAAAATIGHKVAPNGRVELDKGRCCNPTGFCFHKETNVRTFRVMDALASLCVSRGRYQVVAIAARFDFDQKVIQLIIAENDAVANHTVAYLQTIWGILEQLSEIYAKRRKHSSFPGDCSYYFLESPKIPVGPGRGGRDPGPLVEALVEHVYGFTIAKYNKRVGKWWEPLQSFRSRFLDIHQRPLEGLEIQFVRMTISFNHGLAQLRSTATNWAELVICMDHAVIMCDDVLKAPGQCEIWAHQVAGSNADIPAFPLRRAMEKLTSHHRYIRELVGFAHSPRLRRAFSLAMTVIQVPYAYSGSRVLLPASVEEWKSILAPVLEDPKVVEAGSFRLDTKEIQKRYNGKEYLHRIHCECALIAFLEASRERVPSFSYIGLSKLSCRPCHLWLQCFNARQGRQYYTRGTHGKWYHPWTMPLVPGWSATAPVAESLRADFASRLVVWAMSRSKSDSTDASGETQFDNDEQTNARNAICNAELAALGIAIRD